MSRPQPQEVERVRREVRQEQRASTLGEIANEFGASLQAVGFNKGIKKHLREKEVCYKRAAQVQTVTPYYRTAVGRGPDKVQGVNQKRSRAQKARRQKEGAGMSTDEFIAQEATRQRLKTPYTDRSTQADRDAFEALLNEELLG